MQEFPKWIFKDGASRLVQNAAAQADYGPGWSENPNGFPEPEGAGLTASPAAAAVAAAYVPKEYPKMLYRRLDAQVIERAVVADADAEAVLGPDWSEDPTGVHPPTAAPPVPVVEGASLEVTGQPDVPARPRGRRPRQPS